MIDPEDPIAEENRLLATRELGMISELQGMAAFAWFLAEFVDKPFRAAEQAMKREYSEANFVRYTALLEIRKGILEREIAHREAANPADTRLAYLRDTLLSL